MVASGNTEAGKHVVENRKEGSLELERGGEPDVDRGDGSESKGNGGDQLDLGVEVAPSKRGKLFLGGEDVVDIIIGNVDVYWDVLVGEIV